MSRKGNNRTYCNGCKPCSCTIGNQGTHEQGRGSGCLHLVRIFMVEFGNRCNYYQGFRIWDIHRPPNSNAIIRSSIPLFPNQHLLDWIHEHDPINDNRNHRFYAEFVLFCSGMLGMVLADSFLWLFIFWELMGLCSTADRFLL